MTPVDLDALERAANAAATDGPYARITLVSAETAFAVVAELRAAREVVEALHAWESMPGMFFGHTPEEGGDVGRALIAYDQAVGS